MVSVVNQGVGVGLVTSRGKEREKVITLLVLSCMGRQLVLELGEFSADRGATGEVTDDKGRRGVGVNVRRGNVRGEVGVDAFPEVVVLEAVDTEFPSVYCFLIVLLVLVDKVEVSLDGEVCPLVAFQFSTHGEFPYVIDRTIDLVC